ncbi:putative histidine--tRNA ligase [Rosa chinensis]|uniref:Histidine--tRNA ligase, cytoplasmic n=1 Tax=Rosa chinensis TaxID=74649 RepID=A0A2P6PKR9_ROSCH|nr:histidine--tRNA ligase, cytoplasmic [Rosa chinensis]PRQ22521.1 putative histidine--tRNA ligase [Rosa chinensis]
MAGLAVIRVGGKGSSLSSSAVYAVANALAHVTIDSSALDRLSSSSSSAANLKPYHLVSLLPSFPSVQESRASLVVLLAKLLSLNIRTVLPVRIAAALNSGSAQDLGLETLDLTEEEALALEKLKDSSALYGVCALLDHQSAALSTVSDAVAALSCEALKADVAGFNSVDAGDGYAAKEVIGVASDLKVLLNGSKLVGKVETEAVSEIPKIHASLRVQVKLVHAKTREELNSGAKVGKGGSRSARSERTALLALAAALFDLGDYSLRRAKLDLEAVGSESLRLRLVELFGKQCPTGESLRGGLKLVQELAFEEEENYVKFAHAVNVLMELVWKIVTWEAITVFVALEGAELTGKGQGGEVNGEVNAKTGKKSEKKKKAVLGKGTTVMVQLIKDKLQGEGGNAVDCSELLENWVKELLFFLDPKSSEFDGLLNKVKEIVESNETRRLPKLPKGTRDFAKEQMTIRKKAFSIIEDVFERHGATALDTPVFELRDTLTGKYGEDSKLIYDLADQGGELSSLRYDLTVPFARYVAMNGITSFKRYQIAKVYRRDNPSKGRYREFYQCDFDIAGQSEKMGPDFEAVYVLTELLDELNIGDYEVKLNHRKLLDGMLEICGVPPEKFRTICSSIDKLDKQSFEQIKKEMVEEKGLSVETADRIGTFVKERGHPLELLSKLKQEGSEFLENNSSIDALNDLEILFKCLEKSQCIGKVVFDLSLARGLDYYTGVIYEAVFKGGAQMGSIAAGGRYDNLIGMFGTKQVPAVGVSLGIERVFAIMEQLHKDQNQTTRATKTEVLVSILGDDIGLAAELSGELWKGKVQAEFLVNKRVTKHFDRAKDSKIPWMIIVGEKEQNEGVVRLKNIAAGEEVVIQRSDIVEELKKRLNA